MALAFGHPLAFSGKVTYGANDASSLTIIRDNTFGSFKLANVTGSLGTVDQDRMAGMRARLGAGPKTVPVTTKIHNLDKPATGQRIGTTQVAEPDYLALATEYGIVANYDSTFDKSAAAWPRRAGRSPAPGPAGRSSPSPVQQLVGNGRPDRRSGDRGGERRRRAELQRVRAGDDHRRELRLRYQLGLSQQLRITKMAVSVNGGKWTSPKMLRVKVGDTLRVRTTMRGYRSATDQKLVPR